MFHGFRAISYGISIFVETRSKAVEACTGGGNSRSGFVSFWREHADVKFFGLAAAVVFDLYDCGTSYL